MIPRQLVELSQPFPDDYIHKNPSGGGSYIKHHVITQRLIQVLGYPPSFERVEVIYGDVPELIPDPQGSSKRAKEGRPALKNVVVGVIARLTLELHGREVAIEEAGDCEDPHNWTTCGQRLKDAMSDAYKRCAMRLGCGLHLWSGDEYFLYQELTRLAGSGQPEPSAVSTAAPPQSGTGSEESAQGSPANTAPSHELAEAK